MATAARVAGLAAMPAVIGKAATAHYHNTPVALTRATAGTVTWFFAAKLGAGEGTRATRRVGMSG
jgi:hypothetical protein